MDFWSFINNSWVVGISGGILSGLITTWIGRKFFSGRDKKEYAQRVEATNREIIYSLRSAISDRINFERDTILSLIAATARKNGVLQRDVYSVKELTEDLIKEIMDSSFISSNYKKEFCENLSKLYLKSTGETSSNFANEKESKKRNDSVIAAASRMLGIMVALLTLALSLAFSKNDVLDEFIFKIVNSNVSSSTNVLAILLPVFIALLSMVLVFGISIISRKKSLLSLHLESTKTTIKETDKNKPEDSTIEKKEGIK